MLVVTACASYEQKQKMATMVKLAFQIFQHVCQEILNLLLLLNTYPYDQWSMQIMVSYLLQISLDLFFPNLKELLAENRSIVRARTRFADVENSIKFLLEIITLVSTANNFGSAREFILNCK
jgi:hypothetical protein